MSKPPVVWDSYNPNGPEKKPEPPPNRSDLAYRAKHAPGPALKECAECGADANPCWTDGPLNFCRSCVPDELRYPGR